MLGIFWWGKKVANECWHVKVNMINVTVKVNMINVTVFIRFPILRVTSFTKQNEFYWIVVIKITKVLSWSNGCDKDKHRLYLHQNKKFWNVIEKVTYLYNLGFSIQKYLHSVCFYTCGVTCWQGCGFNRKWCNNRKLSGWQNLLVYSLFSLFQGNIWLRRNCRAFLGFWPLG